MQLSGHKNITQLLNSASGGDNFALDKILPLVYNELRKISSKYLRDEYRQHTLQTTELVHEAYLKLIGTQDLSWESRAHFYGIAAKSMRQILVDYARKRKSQKRGNGKTLFSLDEANIILGESEDQLLNLNEALTKLEGLEERSCKIVELRFFSGLTIEETAEVLNVSVATVKRDWQFAKAWLYREIN
ncbi:MAG: sigma-70 family RNA polymerase sigma factor [Ignavibacteriales bacterium]|nr:sigma-70 family RNA polymerase sigma factor [Ignavibacteriota bacterium]MCB0747856.1 sigma-70 family RNA polymerase sigma factor [Ignavibacteriota bacterium]MCB9248525.1 sigma-70 family RNA polymerase sigma factor [Ignavibacteriales bacterium]